MLRKNIKKISRFSVFTVLIFFLFSIGVFIFAPHALAACSKGEGLIGGALCKECLDTGACTKCDLVNLIAGIANGSLMVVGPIGVFCIALSGFFYMISAGKMGGESNIQGVARAKMALSASITGIIISVTAWLIINTILGAMGYIGFGGGTTETINGIVQPAPWYRVECNAKDLHIEYDIKIV